MPLYNYKCDACKHGFESYSTISRRKKAKCRCGKTADQVLVSRPAAVHSFKLGWFEHIGPDPIYVKNKKQLREECNRHGCYAKGFD